MLQNIVIVAFLVLYVVNLGQNWAVYTAAMLAAVYRLHSGRLTAKLQS